ncbi:MAG TPA: hypothetical protein PKI32_05540 [Opitutales bacterium]|nr:hypothetical protein [Opitutales bacterium]
MAADLSTQGENEGGFPQKLLRASVWTLPFLMPVVAYLLVAYLTPLFDCGCFIIKMLVIFGGAYAGIVLANLLSRRRE